MWMTNGERCYARWLPKDHALELKRKEQNCARLFCRQRNAICVQSAIQPLVSNDTPSTCAAKLALDALVATADRNDVE
jgi:hypothetical protein